MKRSKSLLISLVFGGLYSLYLVFYFFNKIANATTLSEALGANIEATLITPHMIFMVLGFICNVLAYGKNKSGYALLSCMLYACSALLFLLYAPFVVIEIIFSLIGYCHIKCIHTGDETLDL